MECDFFLPHVPFFTILNDNGIYKFGFFGGPGKASFFPLPSPLFSHLPQYAWADKYGAHIGMIEKALLYISNSNYVEERETLREREKEDK